MRKMVFTITDNNNFRLRTEDMNVMAEFKGLPRYRIETTLETIEEPTSTPPFRRYLLDKYGVINSKIDYPLERVLFLKQGGKADFASALA